MPFEVPLEGNSTNMPSLVRSFESSSLNQLAPKLWTYAM
jgi:hypothetical protein